MEHWRFCFVFPWSCGQTLSLSDARNTLFPWAHVHHPSAILQSKRDKCLFYFRVGAVRFRQWLCSSMVRYSLTLSAGWCFSLASNGFIGLFAMIPSRTALFNAPLNTAWWWCAQPWLITAVASFFTPWCAVLGTSRSHGRNQHLFRQTDIDVASRGGIVLSCGASRFLPFNVDLAKLPSDCSCLQSQVSSGIFSCLFSPNCLMPRFCNPNILSDFTLFATCICVCSGLLKSGLSLERGAERQRSYFRHHLNKCRDRGCHSSTCADECENRLFSVFWYFLLSSPCCYMLFCFSFMPIRVSLRSKL